MSLAAREQRILDGIETALQAGETEADAHGTTGTESVGEMAGTGAFVPSTPMRNAVAGFTCPVAVHWLLELGF